MSDDQDLRRLAGIVGDERFRAACEWAWRTAAGTGTHVDRVEWPGDLADVPHDLADPVWYESEQPLAVRLRVAQALYRAMPCYGNLMYTMHFYGEFGEVERAAFWQEYRALLADADDRLADPIAYSLWVDYFEAGYDEAWLEVTSLDPPWERRMERVLPVSGPVRWKLKEPVYLHLADDERWHPFIVRGLIGSAFDAYGKLEPRPARSLLRRLRVSHDVPGLSELEQKLRA